MTHLITRQALHDRVWETPLKVLALEFATDPTSLSKLCRLFSVPTSWLRQHTTAV